MSAVRATARINAIKHLTVDLLVGRNGRMGSLYRFSPRSQRGNSVAPPAGTQYNAPDSGEKESGMIERRTLTLDGFKFRRILSFLAGAGMITASIMTMDHFFKANYPKTIFAGSFCDISAFFNCDSSAFSEISQIMGVPLGFFGMFMGALVVLGTVFPSEAFERTNKSLSLLNFVGVISLFLYSVLQLGSLCLLCSGFYLFSIF